MRLQRETIHIYPYGEDKAVKFVREAQATDNVIIDNNYITVIVTGYEKDDIFGYTVNLFLLNKTDKNVMFSVDEASVMVLWQIRFSNICFCRKVHI